jgi:hypothetical protein
VDWIHLAGLVAGCCKHGNEPSGSIKGGEYLELAELVKKGPAVRNLLVSKFVSRVKFSGLISYIGM